MDNTSQTINVHPRVRGIIGVKATNFGNLSELERRQISPNVQTRAGAYQEALEAAGVKPTPRTPENTAEITHVIGVYAELHGPGAKATRCAAASIFTMAYLHLASDPAQALGLILEALSMFAEAGPLVQRIPDDDSVAPKVERAPNLTAVLEGLILDL